MNATVSDLHGKLVASIALLDDLRPYSLHAVWFGGARYYRDDLPSKFIFRANTLERAKAAVGRAIGEYGSAPVIVGPHGQRWIFDDGAWEQIS